MTDIRLYHTDDGGEIDVVAGRFVLDDTPATAAYLSLFGGNERDANLAATEHLQWWGNLLEGDGSRHLRSETQHLLRTLPALSANLPRLATAVQRDLAWMESALAATITSRVTMPALNSIAIEVALEIDGTRTEFSITKHWGPE